jgi:hypothetical protein
MTENQKSKARVQNDSKNPDYILQNFSTTTMKDRQIIGCAKLVTTYTTTTTSGWP